MNIETLNPYLGLLFGIFLLGYTIAIGILLYHLHTFGTGRHTKRIFYIISYGSIFLICITILAYMHI